jgi:hypothetical protein
MQTFGILFRSILLKKNKLSIMFAGKHESHYQKVAAENFKNRKGDF